MSDLTEILTRISTDLLGRASGPLHFRFLMMPTVVSTLAIRAGLRDAREGRKAFVLAVLGTEKRFELIRSALRDIGRILIVALVLDTTYQAIVFRTFYVGEALIVAAVSAVLPYLIFRGPVSVIAGFVRQRKEQRGVWKVKPGENQ